MSLAGRRYLVAFIASVGLLWVAAPVRAATLTHVRDYLLRQQANLASGEGHQLFFSPATSLPGSGNSLVYEFPDYQDGQWCRTPGNDLTVTGIVDPNGDTENAVPLPGTLIASCTQGSGVGSVDTITITGVDPLTAGTVYGVKVEDGTTATLGTPAAGQGLVVILSTTDGITTIDSLLFYISTISNDQVVVSAIVASTTPPSSTNPTVVFNGYSAPHGTVTVIRNGAVTAGTAAADSLAKFSLTLTDQPTGAVVYEVTGVDADGSTLSSVTFGLNLSVSTTTVINGVFLGPSIAVDKNGVKIGTPVTVSGTTAPGSAVTLNVHSVRALSYALTADAFGDWSKKLDTTVLGIGTHTAQAQALLDGTAASEMSGQVTFAVNPLGLFDGKPPADLNGDGRVNIVDFSILLFYWRQTNPANARVDINKDGHVDLIDFSIMLYQWTG